MKRALWTLIVLAATSVLSRAAGLIIIHDEDFWRHPPPVLPHPHPPPHPIPPPPRPMPPPRRIPPRPPVWAPLEVAFTQVNGEIKDQFATTKVEQEFYNPNPRQLEGTFLFPVPKGAHINKFTMEINGKPVEAELLAADKARGIYEDIVRKLRDPALLEYAGRDLFKVRIFPIEPHAKKRITLSYSQLLKADGGLLHYIFPLNTEKYSAKPLKSLSVKIDLETKRALKSIYSPSHKVEIKRHGANKATVGFEASEVKPDADFQLLYSQEADDVDLSLLTCRARGEDGYFVLLASPGAQVKHSRVIPKDIAFVLDTSGSMAGAKLEQAKKALAFCVENLNDDDRFEILRFSTEVEPLYDKLVLASKENRNRAQTFISGLKPIGGTAIDDALRKALALRPATGDRPFVVIFLTDGRPTVGTTDENLIVKGVTEQNRANTRIFCFGIGTDVNTHLLDRITEETKSFSQYVLPTEDLEVKLSNFYTKIKEPVLANPKITFPETIRVTKLYPASVPDLFKGEQLVLAGRFSGHGSGAIQIEGSVAGETKRYAQDVKFPEEADDHAFIPRLWATRRIGYLLDEIRLRGESKELKDEVTDLARKYGVVTPYTAYLILEDEGRRGVAQDVRTLFELQRTPEMRARLSYGYSSFAGDKSGALAVSGARSAQRLKAAEAPAAVVEADRSEVLLSLAEAAPAPSFSPAGLSETYFEISPDTGRAPAPSFSPAGPSRGLSRAGSPVATNQPAAEWARERSDEFAQQSQYVGGRTFYWNGSQWVDSEVQKATQTQPVRIQFGSREYFELLKQHPQTAAWLSLGANLQFVLDGTLYEIFE